VCDSTATLRYRSRLISLVIGALDGGEMQDSKTSFLIELLGAGDDAVAAVCGRCAVRASSLSLLQEPYSY
jgi:hypothetical protein